MREFSVQCKSVYVEDTLGTRLMSKMQFVAEGVTKNGLARGEHTWGKDTLASGDR